MIYSRVAHAYITNDNELRAMQKHARTGATEYLKAHNFIGDLKRCKEFVPTERIIQLKRLALSGDIEGAYKGLRLAIRGR